jgi:catecholate siderophore receptor
MYLEQDNVTDYGLPAVNGAPVPGVDWENWYGYRDLNREQSEFHSTTGRIDHDFSDKLKLRSQIRYQDADLDSLTSGPRTPDTVAGTVVVNPNWRITDSTLAINQTDLSYRFASGPLSHTLVGGFEISREDYDRDNRSPDQVPPLANLWEPDPDVAYDPTFHLVTGVESQVDTQAVYLIDTVDIGERWQVAGGARYDNFSAETETLTPATGITTDFDKDVDMWNYTASISYKPLRNGSIYLSWGTSYNPSAEAGSLIAGAETLDPEENESWELGTKWSLLDRRVDVAAALFRIDKTNARTRELTTEPFRITGEQRVDGIELTLMGQLTDNWTALAGYTHLDSEVLESANPLEEGNPLARTPDDSFNLWTSWEMRPGVSLGFGANYVGDQTVSASNTAEVGSYWLLEASLGYEVNDKLSLSLNTYNLADEDYIEKAHGGGSHAIPGAGRTALLTVSWRP